MDEQLEQAAQRLLAGGLVAFPTETVYGLGADAENTEAIARIYAAKGRPANHPVIVHLPDSADINYWAKHVPCEALRLIDAFWPGPLTLIVARADHIPDAVSGGQDTIGLRCPAHPVAQALLKRFAALKGGHGGVAAPSANLFGQVSPTRAEHVRAEFSALSKDELLILEGGASEVGIESTIVDVSRLDKGIGPVVLRPGHITASQIADALGLDVEAILSGSTTSSHETVRESSATVKDGDASEGSETAGLKLSPTPRVSGSLKAHYAPRTPLWVVPGDVIAKRAGQAVSEGYRVACIVFEGSSAGVLPEGVDRYSTPMDPVVYARDLYALLRELDSGGYTLLIFEQPPTGDAWRAVNDRLGRAAAAFL